MTSFTLRRSTLFWGLLPYSIDPDPFVTTFCALQWPYCARTSDSELYWIHCHWKSSPTLLYLLVYAVAAHTLLPTAIHPRYCPSLIGFQCQWRIWWQSSHSVLFVFTGCWLHWLFHSPLIPLLACCVVGWLIICHFCCFSGHVPVFQAISPCR